MIVEALRLATSLLIGLSSLLDGINGAVLDLAERTNRQAYVRAREVHVRRYGELD